MQKYDKVSPAVVLVTLRKFFFAEYVRMYLGNGWKGIKRRNQPIIMHDYKIGGGGSQNWVSKRLLNTLITNQFISN